MPILKLHPNENINAESPSLLYFYTIDDLYSLL